MRGALSLAALLLLSNRPVFANADAIELDCEAETGIYRVITEDSTNTTDDSGRRFWMSINKNDGTFDMVQGGGNEEPRYLNRFGEQGLYEYDDFYEKYNFSYSKESSYPTYDLNTGETERINMSTYIDVAPWEDGFIFTWKIKTITAEGEYRETLAMYRGQCVRKN